MFHSQKIVKSITRDWTTVSACIKYEILENCPVEESYDRICRKLGKDIMVFKDFEFWYWKYFHGDLEDDLDNENEHLYEEFVEMEPLKITNLSVEVLEMVVRNLSPIERLAARHISTPFKLATLSLIPNYHTLTLSPDRSKFRIKMDQEEILYKLLDDGCGIEYGTHSIKIKDADFWNIAMQDVLGILSNENLPRKLNLDFKTRDTHLTDQFVDFMQERNFEFRDFQIITTKPKQAVTVLGHLVPRTLRSIRVVNPEKRELEELRNIMRMEQWRQAKSVDVTWLGALDPNDIQHFYGFDHFEARFREVPSRVLNGLRDAIARNRTFQFCKLNTVELFDFATVSFHFPPTREVGNRELWHYYRIQGTRYDLEFKFMRNLVEIKRVHRKIAYRFI